MTSNETGVTGSLDQAGIKHKDIKFVYGDPTKMFIPEPGIGGAESFKIARELGLDPLMVDLAEALYEAQTKLEELRMKKAQQI